LKEGNRGFTTERLSGGDAADEVFLLGLGFGADGEGVKEIEAEGKIEGFVLAVAEVALAEDFHADDSLAGGAHFFDYANDSGGIGVHERSDGIDADKMDFDPGRFGGGAKRFDAVAGAAMGADNAFFLGFGENVHDALEAVSPIAFGEAVHQADIDVIGAKLAAEAVEICASGGVACPSFGEDGDFMAGDMLEGFGDVQVAAVGIGGVEEAQAVVVAIEEQVRETLESEGGLMRMVPDANGAGAYGEAARLDAGLAESDGVRGAEFSRERRESKGAAREGRSVERERAGGASGSMEEFTAFHGASLRQRFKRQSTS